MTPPPSRARSPTLVSALLTAGLAAIGNPRCVAAKQVQSADEASTASQQTNPGQDALNNGRDLTRPENSFELRFRSQQSSGEDSTTDKERLYLLATSRIVLDQWWKLSLLGQIEEAYKKTVSDKSPATEDSGFGDSVVQAVLIRTLNERWAFGFGARVVAPTAEDDLGPGKWLVMPGFGVRYSLTELGSDSYFVPAMRYDVSVAGSHSRRDISDLQMAPTLNIDLPERWFLTLYPSYDIRINYGEPASGQTGHLFLPADFAIGRELCDRVVMSLEIGVPIIKDYPVYDYKAQLRLVLKE
ncbi:MAG: transporter [Rhodomicrobium sp.]